MSLTDIEPRWTRRVLRVRAFTLAALLAAAGSLPAAADDDDVSAEWWYGVRLSLDVAEVSEDGGAQTVIVTANVSEWGVRLFSPTVIEVTVGKSGDSAVSGTDYRAVPKFNITIPKARQGGHTSFSLEPLGDAEWEGAEEITIHGRHVTDRTPDSVAGTSLTVTDEGDRPYTGSQVVLSVNPSKVSEADSATTVEVTARSGAQSVSRRVMVTLSSGVATATWGVDYEMVHNFDITLPANAVSATGTFTLTPIQDTVAEGDETITIMGQVDGHDSGVTGTTLTLTDDDAPPAVTLSASPSSVTENGGAKTVTVTATSAAAASNARTVLVAVGNPRQDTATPGTDYATVPNFTITIAANATTATGSFVLTPTDDTAAEDAESISIGGAPESDGAAFAVAGTAMTLTDDDAQPAVTLSAAPASVSEGADPTTVTVTATAASAVAWARKVRVAVGTGASTATFGVDYKLVPNFDIAIAANATTGTGTFTLTPIQDTTNEGNETIGVAGQSPNTTVTGTTLTLADDDIHPAVTLSTNPSSVGEEASATSVTVTATAAAASATARTVTVSVGDSGTATSGTDYAAVSDFTITIAANATAGTGTFTLTPTQDTTVEGSETIGVAGASPGTQVTSAAVTLTDDDSYPAVTLSANPSTVGEDAAATSVTVTATATSSVATARTVTVSVGQTGTAASGADYEAVPDFTIAIAANATTGTGAFTLTPTQDAVVEGSETVGVSGSSPSTTVTGTTLTITDDDNYPAVTLSTKPASVGEEASATTVTVTAAATSSVATARTVTVSVGGSGTATSGTDYTAVSDFTITIAANATSGTGTFTLTPTQDTTYEGNETIGVAGTSPSTTVTGTTVTLIDDELPTITLSRSPSIQTHEDRGAKQYTVTATRPETATGSAVSVTVSVGASDDEAIEGIDYQSVSDFTITIAANATSGTGSFSLQPIDDSHPENAEMVSISGTATGYKVTGTSVYIADNEDPLVVLVASPSSVSEGASGTQVTVTATMVLHSWQSWPSWPVTVRVGGSGTATSGTDYAAVSNFTITLPANQETATGTFTLTPTQDTLLEGDETISVSGSGTFLNVEGTTLTLTDDDQPTIALSANPSSVSEGASATQVTVTATAVSSKSTARTVTVSVGDTGTATSGTDYAAVSDFDITIAANATSGTGTFTLTPTQDTSVESNETIGVAGTNANTNVAGTTVTLTDDENPAVTLTAAPSSVSEGAAATTVTVTATAVSAMTSARTVTVSVGDGGTATSGTDYAAVSDFDITIAANATTGTGTFTLTPTQDAANEGDETVGVSGTSTGATVTGTTVTLTDIDLPRITLETVPANLKVAEGASQSSVTVRATTAAPVKAATTVTLTVGASADSATKTTDYAVSNVGTITLRANGTRGEASFDLAPVQDSLVEGDETISVSGSSGGGHAVTGTSLTLTDDDSHDIALSANPSSVGEGAGATSVTVTATARSSTSSARTVTVKVGGRGTATSGTDYAAVSDFDITIAANATSGTGTFTLTPTQDTAVEGSETIGVSGTSPNSTVAATTVTLADDDSYPAVTLSANPSSVSEGASGTTVTVTATAVSAVSSARTVTVSVGGSGTATAGVDYATVADFTVALAANATSGTGTFTLTPTQDKAVEGAETIGLAGTSASSTVTGTTLTLTDDDTHAIVLSTDPKTVAEDKASEKITVTATINLPRTTATTVTVSVGDAADTAKSGTDYKAVSDFTLTIAANSRRGTGTFTFEPKTDKAYEGLESVTIGGTASESGAGASATGPRAANASTGIPVTNTSLSLHDASNYPSVTLSASPSSVSESDSATSVTVTATATSAIASSREVTVSVGGTGTATSGTDYAAVSDFIVTIAANATSGTGTFTLTPTDDSTVEGSETIGVAGSSLSTTVTGTTLTLTDDDSAAVTVNNASASEGSDMTFTVTLDTAVVGGLTVTPSFTDVTATEGTDYDENTTALSFTGNANETKTFTVSTTQDSVVEGDETFTVGLTVSGTTLSGSITSTDTGTGTIQSGTETNVDTATLTIDDASADEGDGITFTVTLSEAVQGGLTVTPSYTNGTAASGDYTANTTALSFTGTKGETETFTVSTTEDAVLEANETFTVGMTVSGTTLGSRITSTDTGTGTIDNDDSAAVTVNDASADEGASMTFTVTLDKAVQGGLTVTPDFTDVTATEGTDYDENTTALTFTGTKGETKTFTVSTDEDAVLEADETFTVGLSVSGAPTGVTAADTGTGTIDDDDSAAVTVNDADADEGDDMTFTVTLSEAVQGGLKVTPSFTDVSAEEGTDYDENTTALTFTGTKGETKTFTVSTTEDAVLEADETFTVGLAVSDAPTGTTVTATDTGTGTIDNDDSAAVTVNDADADEGDGITFTVTLGAAVQGGLTVTPGYTNGTAANGDYSKNTSALTFTGTADETKTFTVSTTEDAVLEADETFTVSLAVSGTSLGVTATDTGTGTIDNDDSAAVTISDANADEGNSMTFTVTLGTAVQGGLKVTPDFTDVTAVEGTDYDENTAALSFTGTANEKKTFTVSTTEDAVVEGNETFTVGLTVSGTVLSVTDTDTGTGTVNNDDGAVVTVNNSNASEGDDITFTVTLGAAVQGGLTVTPSFTDVTAVEGTDYDENTTALSFTGTKGETKTFTVSTTEDAVLEADETFTVGLSASNSSVTDTDTGTGTIDNDDSAAVTVNDASADEGDGMTFTVTLDKAVQGGLKVTPGYTDGTASSDDYTRNTAALTFTGTANETKTFTVSTAEDAVLEANETFTVDLTVSGTTLGVTATDDGTGTIDNDDGATVTVNDASASEGNGIAFTVTLGEAVQGGLTVTPSFTDGTATEGTDYDENTTALSFAGTKGETKKFTVSTTEDNLFEADETFTVGLSASNSAVTSTDTGTGTIDNDDDAPEVNLSLSPSSVGESASATSVTVTAAFSNSTVYEADKTVTVSVGGSGTATSGTDYAAVSDFDVTIAKGQSSGTGTFTFTPTHDTLVEGNETIGVAGSVAGLTMNGADLVLIDDDGAPEVNLSVTPSSMGEGDPATQVTVTAAFSNASTFSVDTTVTVSVGDAGTASAGLDYDWVSNFDVTIPKGKTSGEAAFTLTPTQDTLIEGAESVGVTGSATGLKVNGADLMLTDDDGAPEVNLSVTPSRVDEGAAGTQVTVKAAFSNESTYVMDKTVRVSVGGSGTATSGTDYAAVTDFDVTISSGRTSGRATFILAPTQDTLVEGDETIGVAGTATGMATGMTVNGTALTLTDDDDAPEVNLSVTPSSMGEGDAATQVTVTATFSNSAVYEVDKTVTVSVGGSGTATSGTDYAAVTNFDATIASGTTSGTATFTLTPTDDDLVEGDETIGVAGMAAGLSVNGANLTLTDDDEEEDEEDEDGDVASLTLTSARAEEGEGLTFTVTLDRAVAGGFTVTPGYADGTALSGVDYAPNTSPISFSGTANEQHSFTVDTTEDAEVEPDETFSVDMTVETGGAGAVPAGSAPNIATAPGTGTIENDDKYRIVVQAKVRLSADPDSLSEDADPVTVELTATADGAVSSERTVTVSVGDAGDSAVEGTDYAAVDDFDLTIAANAATGTSTFTLAPNKDDLVEGDETITISGSGKDMDVKAATIALKDADTAAVELVLSPDSISENGGVSTVTATLSAAADEETVVTVSLSPVAPGAAEDATLTGTTLVIPAGETLSTGDVTVTAVDNAAVEADRTFLVSGAASGGRGASDPDDEDLLVRNDDRANLTVEDASIREGRTLKFAVTLDSDVEGGVSVTPALSDITARAGVDYEAGVAPLHFAGVAGETRTVSVPTIQDDLIEGAERFSLHLTATALSGGIGVQSAAATGVGLFVDEGATGTIRDDDRAKLTIEDASAEEGEAMTFTVTLDNDVPGGLTAKPSFTDGSATAGADYRANARALRFAGTKGETRTIVVETIQDQLVESDETFAVSLEAATSVKVEAGEGATGTIRDNDETIEVSVSLTPDTVSEGETARFRIALSAPSNEVPVTVDYATEDGTATARADYESAAGTVTFQPGETLREVPVLVLDDVKNEPVETFSLRILNLAGGPTVLGTAEATAFIDEADPMPAAWLARFGRTAADHAVEAVAERMESGATGSGVQAPTGGNDLLSSFGGGSAWAANGGRPVGVLPNGDASPLQRMTDREFLAASSFTTPLGRAAADDAGAAETVETDAGNGEEEDDGARWTAWGRGASTRFDGRDGDLSLDGEVATATVGVDARTGKWVAGVAVSHSAGDGRYDAPEANDGGRVDSDLTTVTPYLRFALNDRVSLWGVLGRGDGDLTLSEDRTGAAIRTSLEMTMAALGLRGVVLPAKRANGFELAVRTDAMAVWMNSDASADMLAAETETSRLRLMLEGSRAFRMDGGGSLTPTLELGLRHDDGDAEQGLGLELGGRLAWSAPGSGLKIEGHVRGVLAHEDEGYEDLSFGGSIQFDPGVQGRGLALSVSPSRGDGTSGAERMWSPNQQYGGRYGSGLQDQGDRLETRLNYGMAGPRGLGDLTPYAGVDQLGDSRSFLLGGRWEFSEAMRLEVRATQRQGLGNQPAANEVQIQFTLNR